MATHSNANATVNSRLALEALRSGVPNREAVRLLGCNQPSAESRFTEMLSANAESSRAQGMLVTGDFGAGKSHLLAHLEHQALEAGFACSKVVISKETPFYDLGKVFASAMENGRLPDRNGRLIEELAQAMKPDSEKYAAFFKWANDAATSGLISPMLPATLMVHERLNDLELNGEIESFWAGDRILISRVKSGLRQIGQQKTYTFRAPKAADLPPQRLRFAIELIKGAGYAGWVILLDEIELIGSYSILQRGRSYAELARLMGQTPSESYPGLIVVGTATDDFASAIISPDGAKKDKDYIVPRLEANARYSAIADRAETGMNLLENSCLPLSQPDDDYVNATLEKLRRIYSEAYGWDAPRLEGKAGGAGFRGRMRHKVRASINAWDLLRLFPDSNPDTISDEFTFTYDEDHETERESADADGGA